MASPGERETWHARAPFWIGLALTAVSGFSVLQARLAVAEARHEAAAGQFATVNARLAALEARCR